MPGPKPKKPKRTTAKRRQRADGPPASPEWRSSTIRHAKKRAFLAAYAQIGTIKAAAAAAKIDRNTHADWMKKDRVYANAFVLAQEEAIESLETEAVRRAMDGWDEPVFHQGEQVGLVRKYSNTLLIFLLKAARPDRYRERFDHQISGPHGGPVQVQAMRDQVHHMMTDPKAVALAESLTERLAMQAGVDTPKLPAVRNNGGRGNGRNRKSTGTRKRGGR